MSKPSCTGCRNDFYNGKQNFNTFGCWSRKEAKAVTRYRIYIHTKPTRRGAFTRVRVFNCRREEGFALYEKLPDFATDVRRES